MVEQLEKENGKPVDLIPYFTVFSYIDYQNL